MRNLKSREELHNHGKPKKINMTVKKTEVMYNALDINCVDSKRSFTLQCKLSCQQFSGRGSKIQNGTNFFTNPQRSWNKIVAKIFRAAPYPPPLALSNEALCRFESSRGGTDQ